MFGPDLVRRYPSLADYLSRTAHATGPVRPYLPAVLTAGIGVVMFTVCMAERFVPGAGLSMVPLGASAYLASTAYRSAPASEKRLRGARSIARTMKMLFDGRRLHRVLDPTSMDILDEAATCWGRIRRAMDSDRWDAEGLPPSYASARAQTRLAADEAMAELLYLYEEVVRTRAHQTHGLEFLTELGEGLFKTRARAELDPPPAVVWPARSLAARLQELADEADRLSEAAPTASVRPAERIDSALGELRAIRQAEAELRERT
jgi:hypothetical protein